jgi:HK97 family phage major capsid protein/HK97 family phage prohead protease
VPDSHLQSYKRELAFTRAAVDEERRTVRLSFSSETPVDRYGEDEILDHSPESVDLTRMKSGASVLLNHDRDKLVGVIEGVEIGNDRRGYATIRFGKGPLASEVFEDVKDGIRTLVSVGYEVKAWQHESRVGDRKTYRVTSWTPYEISLVSIPADASVGVGRAQQQDIMSKPNITGGDGGPATDPAATAERQKLEIEIREFQANKKRFEEDQKILTVAQEFGVPASEAQKFIAEKRSTEEFLRHALTTRAGATPTVPNSGTVDMSKREKKEYSVLRGIANAIAGIKGLEQEVSQELSKRLRREPTSALGFLVPTDVSAQRSDEVISRADLDSAIQRMQTRGLSTLTGPLGGYLVSTDLLAGSMIELLRNMPILAQLGATQMGGLVGDIAIPRQATGATGYWLGEGAAVTPSNLTLGRLLLTPKRLAAQTTYSRQLLVQASRDVEALVRSDLMTVLAIAKDAAGIQGTGASGQPVGILNTTGLSTVSFGAAPSWAKVVEFETTLETANATMLGMPQWLTTPAVKGKWKTTLKASGVSGYLLENGLANEYALRATNQMPSSNRVIFGNFANVMMADWDGMEIIPDPYTRAGNNEVVITVNLLTDIGVRQPTAFVVSTDSGAQ